MNVKLRKIISKYPKLNFFLRLLKYSHNVEFRKMVLSYHCDPDLILFEQRGNMFPNKNFYDIYIEAPSKGFFALVLQVLDSLRYAERLHLIPIVTWSNECLYKENCPVNGSDNPFEYFFQQTSDFTREEMNQASHVLPYHISQRALDREHPFSVASKTIIENGCLDEYISDNAVIWNKYLSFRQPVLEYLQSNLDRIAIGSHTLGVHVRGTDFNKGYINHAIAVAQEEYIESVRDVLTKNKEIEQIFLATDDSTAVESFCRAFPGMVICYKDVLRSEDGKAVHFTTDERVLHKYKLGIEVLRDAYTLSRCYGLVGSLSNVCIAAQILNRSEGMNYKVLEIINKGFNEKGITVYADQYGKK